jgi:hypothetical protein
MLGKLMRLGRRIRPWMVAVTLAAGGAGLAADCGGSDCEPGEIYGPGPVCTSDADCVRDLGAGWYCDPEVLRYSDGCGGTIEWGRICARTGDADADAEADADVDVAPDVDVLPEDTGDIRDWPSMEYGPDPGADWDYYPPPPYGPIPDFTEDDALEEADDVGQYFYGPPPAPSR